MQEVRELQAAYGPHLTKKPNVVGTGIGHKWLNGKTTNAQALLVFVEKKLPPDALRPSALIPQNIQGIPIDVIETGRIVKHDVLTQRVRPVRPGYSCGQKDVTAGTVGGFFVDRDGDVVVLSNNHVLARENQAQIGDVILQPGMIDDFQDASWRGWPSPIANLPYFATLKNFVHLNAAGNTHDSAIAVVPRGGVEQGLLDPQYPFLDTALAGWGEPNIGLDVQKIGRTTGHTNGKIIAVEAQFGIDYDFGTASFTDCVVMTAMSAAGDSGSIIMDTERKAVALLFAGSDKVTLANPIDIVRNYYGLQLWNAQGVPVAPPVSPTTGPWQVFGSATYNNGVLNINTSANAAAGIQQAAPVGMNFISCDAQLGSDGGATWGPGISIASPSGTLKANLRRGGGFGGYYNTNEFLLGSIDPNGWYTIRIRFTPDAVILEAGPAGGQLAMISRIGRDVFPLPPVTLRVGKTDGFGLPNNFGTPGNPGTCQIKNIAVG